MTLKRISKSGGDIDKVEFTFNGQPISAEPGQTVAAALLAADVRTLRKSSVSASPRGPYCMMGACFECLVEIEGRTVQACITPVTSGARISEPVALGAPGNDGDEAV